MPTDVDDVYTRVYDAVLEQRLLPGTKLPEERLAEIFSVNRARIRQVLARLQHERIVDLVPNRGAFVARPTAEESDDVLEARRVIEPAVLRRLVERATTTDLDHLDEHVAAERRSHHDGLEAEAIRLSGEFHNLLADLAGNTALAHTMRELSALTCLVILVHHAPTASACRPDDHESILRAVRDRDADAAVAAVLTHLDLVGASLTFTETGSDADLDAVFASR
ncbi:MAG TPA: GntR family transcriptional regulator [Marmoricola sp.]|jgi:DNA-binding GntR family transcriptional regulator|nr:GntR family transcriptional regulator [Marmoricola sp.]